MKNIFKGGTSQDCYSFASYLTALAVNILTECTEKIRQPDFQCIGKQRTLSR